MVDVFAPPPVPPRNNSPAAPVKVDNPPPSVVSRSHEPNTPAQDRRQADQDALDRMDPWRRDGKQSMLVRQADGSVVEVPRRDGGTNGVPADGNQPAPPVDQQQPGPDRIKVGDMEFSAEELQGLRERKSIEDSRRALVPASPEDYRTELPADLVLPPGVQVAYSDTDPMVQSSLKSLREFCHANGLGQAEYSRLLALDANRVAIEQSMMQRAHAAEMQKLGETRTARLSAVATWLKAFAGEEGGRALISNLLTAKQVAAYEQMMHRFSSQGGGNYSGAHREVNQPERLSSEAYNKLTYTEKKAYAEEASAREQAIRR
jgi:hypothetical protein